MNITSLIILIFSFLAPSLAQPENPRKMTIFDLSLVEGESWFEDLVLEFKDDGFKWKCNSLLFAAKSEFFRKRIDPGKNLILNETSAIKFKKETMDLVKKFFMFGDADLDDDILESVLAFSTITKQDDLKKVCVDYIKKSISEKNYLEYREIGRSLNLDPVKECTLKYAQKNFQKIVDNQSYLKMDGEFLKDIIESGKINIDDEKKLFQILEDWNSFDSINRNMHVSEFRIVLCENKLGPGEKLPNPVCQQILSVPVKKWTSIANIMKNLTEAVFSLEFHELSFDELSQLLKSDDLKTDTEETTIDAVEEWIKYDAKNREKLKSNLLKNIKWDLLSFKFILNKFDEKLTTTLSLGDELRIYWDNLKSVLEEKMDEINFRSFSKPRMIKETLLINGGFDFLSAKNTDIFNSETDNWESFLFVDRDHSGFSSVILKGNMLIIGGGYNEKNKAGHFTTTSDVSQVNLKNKTITKLPSLNQEREFSPAIVIEESVFVCGGRLDSSSKVLTNSAEMWNPSLPEWKILSPMLSKRSEHAAVAFDSKMFVFGGHNGNDLLNSVEINDPKMDQWSIGEPLPEKMIGCAVSVLKDLIYVIGGSRDGFQSKSVFVLDPKINKWEKSVDMAEPLRGMSAISFHGKIVIAGGKLPNGNYSDKVYEFIPASKKWNHHSTLLFARYRPNLMKISNDLINSK